MKTATQSIKFKATPYMLGKWCIVLLPEDESLKLSSRGQVSVVGTINGHEFKTVLEPDGRWSHWFKLSQRLQAAAGAVAGHAVTIELSQTKEWPEPSIPDDFAAALAAAPEKVQAMWPTITSMARWEWVRWINATREPSTRRRRVEVSISKMLSGKRRPCCFNLAACTDPELSKNGRLIESL